METKEREESMMQIVRRKTKLSGKENYQRLGVFDTAFDIERIPKRLKHTMPILDFKQLGFAHSVFFLFQLAKEQYYNIFNVMVQFLQSRPYINNAYFVRNEWDFYNTYDFVVEGHFHNRKELEQCREDLKATGAEGMITLSICWEICKDRMVRKRPRGHENG